MYQALENNLALRYSPQVFRFKTNMAAAKGQFFGYSEDSLQNLYSKVICRKVEIDTLLSLLGDRKSYSCPAIFVCGHTASGKSFLVRTLLKDLEVRVCKTLIIKWKFFWRVLRSLKLLRFKLYVVK